MKKELAMCSRSLLTLLCAMLGVAIAATTCLGATQDIPVPANPRTAHIAWLSNAAKRCPDLRIATGDTAAVALFLVDRAGIPSRITIRSSSQSAELDRAAVDCVARLRFEPTTRIGDGEAIDSWQQIGWSWALAPQSAPARQPVAAQQGTSQPTPNGNTTVVVSVCADQSGKLTQDPIILSSSNNPALDEAAIKIARAGSAYYRPATPPDGQGAPGCARLSIDFAR